jgi:hypothetical protein
MLRNTLIGAAVFGVLGASAAYIWTAFEFPFAIVVPAFVGWYVVVRAEYGSRKGLIAGLVGGVGFTVVFMLALFFALTDGSPIALTGWMSAVLAASVAGALTGWVLGGVRPAMTVAGFSAIGMLVAVTVAGLMRMVAPSAVDVEGAVQYAYFALSMGVVSTILGAASGAAVSWVKTHEVESGTPSSIAIGHPKAS